MLKLCAVPVGSLLSSLVVAMGMLIVMVMVVPFAIGQSAKCKQSVLDNCSNKLLMIGDEKFVFPSTISNMNKRCRDIKRLENCVKDYSKQCLTGSVRSSLSVLIYGIARTNKGYCVNTRRKKAFIAFGECANQNKATLDRFMTDFTKNVHAIRKYKEPKLRIPLTCCRIMELANQKCPEHSPEAENLIDGYANDILNLLCGEYTEESDKCSSIINKTPNWDKPLQWKVFIQPIVEILEGL